MSDQYSTLEGRSITEPARRHYVVTASANDLLPKPRALYCEADGVVTIEDELGVQLPYTMTRGQEVPFRGTKVTAITGGTFYAWY